MMYSDDRMKFIVEYISAYEQKIKIANKKGLLDSAKMFELFAKEICKLYYEMDFRNLNEEACTFPYFDLISSDEEIFVQVSTVIDVHKKIKNTLENIKDDKKKRFTKLTNVYFFVLHNDSIKNVKDYTGENQIGNISFTKKDNLITTHDIIEKAQKNITFQEKLYLLLKTEFENFNECLKKFEEAIDNSKNVGISNIDIKINNEYEIDRRELLEKIKKDNSKFITIQGREGVGKTVICKKLIENEDNVLFARAERFVEESHLENIWNVDIRKTIELLNGKKIIFFIDALEFIADASKTKLELLESLYNIVNQYENAYIVTSCRTNDKNAFLKIESKYNIISYDVNEVSVKELNLLQKKYPVIRKMSQNKIYEDLLKTPFYINIIIKNGIDIDNITDVNKFRDYIWNNIICLKDKQKKYKIDVKNIEDSINNIVFSRAQKFALGINENTIDCNILYALTTEGIIISNKEGIRLKYDIFEDICFENYFDREYFECKGKYEVFYENIEKMGRCVYRRYQIWISNKLFIKENRDKFIYNLIFNNKISDKWKKQTEIGIVKSNYSTVFFVENELDILEKNLLEEFINIINLYSYDAKIINNDVFSNVQLIPAGVGRENIIRIIVGNSIYCKNTIYKSKIIKLCLDYTNQKNKKDEICNMICTVMQYYIEKTLEQNANKWFKIIDEIDKCLIVNFRLSNYCNKWLNNFFEKILLYYNSIEKNNIKMAKDVMEFTMRNSYPTLVLEIPEKLCDIADNLWRNKKQNESLYMDEDDLYGLCDDYNYLYSNIAENVFLWNIFRLNFKIGFEWAIKFINKSVEEYAKKYPQNVIKTKLNFINENITREYYGNPNMWMACTSDNYVHNLLSDIVYNIKESIISYVDENIDDKGVSKFLEYVKSKIYKESNNVILLTIIENIGMHYPNKFQGFALDLVTSMDIIEWDTNRYLTYRKNPQIEMLKQQIFQKVGIPKISNRYIIDKECNISIEEYVQNIQINGDSVIRKKCYKILEYLYSIVNNDEENAFMYLQIQKMDFRGAKITRLNHNVISIEANITGEAKKVVEKNVENRLISNDVMLKLDKCSKELKDKKECSQSLIDLIDDLITIKNKNGIMASGIEKIVIALVSVILQKENVSIEKKNEYCNFWLEGIEQIIKNDSFIFESTLISKLIEQLYSNISVDIKQKIKLMVLKMIIKYGNDGVINSIQREIIKYLQKDNELSDMIFNTIIMLSNDEMEHQKFNAQYVKEKDKNFKFVPNRIPRLTGVDKQIEQEKGKKYESHRNEIIEKYLYSTGKLKINEFNIEKYDLKMLCHISNCGKNFEDNLFSKVIKEILKLIITIKNDDYNEFKMDIIDVYQEYEIISLFERELVCSTQNSENVIDLLFDDIDFSKFKKETIELYQEILNCFIALYYDSHNNHNIRVGIERKIKYIEQKIKKIKQEYVKRELYRCLYLSPQKYTKWEPSKIETKYVYKDKCFLNEQFCKYGKYNIKDSMKTLYLLKIDELLPEILISVNEILLYNMKYNEYIQRDLEGDTKTIIDTIITKVFIIYSDEIKKDDDLIKSYEGILTILIELNYEKAAVLLDEFRIH